MQTRYGSLIARQRDISRGYATRIFPRRSAARVHRHGAAKHGCGFVNLRRGSVTVSLPPGHRERQVCGTRRDFARRWRVNRVLFRFSAPRSSPGLTGANGPTSPPLKTCSLTMAPASCRAGPGLSPQIAPRLSVGGRRYRSESRSQKRRKSCFIHISSDVAIPETSTSTRPLRKGLYGHEFRRRLCCFGQGRCRFDQLDTVSAHSIGSGSSRTAGSSIGQTRRFGRTIRASRSI